MKRETLHHPKTYALMGELGCSRPAALGYLTLLWDYAGQVSPQGDIGKWPDAVIAHACDWNGKDPDEFVRALVITGWLDYVDDPKVRLLVHDWPDHCERWIKGKLARMQKDVHPLYSEPEKLSTSYPHPPTDTHDVHTRDEHTVHTTDTHTANEAAKAVQGAVPEGDTSPKATTGAHTERITDGHGLRPSPSQSNPIQSQPALGRGITQDTRVRASTDNSAAAAFSQEKDGNSNGNNAQPAKECVANLPLKKLLQFRGLTEREAHHLIAAFGEEHVAACMRIMDARKEEKPEKLIRDPGAYLDRLLTNHAWKEEPNGNGENYQAKPTFKPLPPAEQCASKEEAGEYIREMKSKLKEKGVQRDGKS